MQPSIPALYLLVKKNSNFLGIILLAQTNLAYNLFTQLDWAWAFLSNWIKSWTRTETFFFLDWAWAFLSRVCPLKFDPNQQIGPVYWSPTQTNTGPIKFPTPVLRILKNSKVHQQTHLFELLIIEIFNLF